MGVTAGAVAVSPLASRVAFASGTTYTGDVLVVSRCTAAGTVCRSSLPSVTPNYLKLRPSLGIPGSLALPIGGIFGMHPALAPLKPFYDGGQLGFVHAAGRASGVRSHFQDESELERAAPGTTLATGWIDRVLAARGTGTAFQAVELGSSMIPNSLIGPAPSIALDNVADFSLAVWSGYQPAFGNALAGMHAGLAHPATEQANLALSALSTAAAMQTAGYTPAAGVTYPTTDLGKALKDLAWLIKSNVGLQIACLDYDNWDMHAGMASPATPRAGCTGSLPTSPRAWRPSRRISGRRCRRSRS